MKFVAPMQIIETANIDVKKQFTTPFKDDVDMRKLAQLYHRADIWCLSAEKRASLVTAILLLITYYTHVNCTFYDKQA